MNARRFEASGKNLIRKMTGGRHFRKALIARFARQSGK
jgi:hypothetical protein